MPPRSPTPDLFAAPEPRTPAPPEREVYTPSRLNREARMLLERGLPALWLEGEISNLSRPSSGHWYFSLKDEAAQLRCAMFRQRNLLAKFSPKDGMRVQARGRISLYEPRGDYQFLVDHIEEAGEGALRLKFEQLKAKLAAEGLFAAERKRPLPRLPKRIGVITSPSGAAIRDVLNILRRRFCTIPVLIYPVQVQGAGAAGQIAATIRLASERADCDVLILARGGGSLEDLWAFNEEPVARAIYGCAIPIVSGIGHEVDFTIADFVADIRAPTPSGAAEIVAPDCAEWTRHLNQVARRLTGSLTRLLTKDRQRLSWVERRLNQLHPRVELRQRAQRIDELEQRLERCFRQRLKHDRGTLAQLAASLRQHSPALRVAASRGRLAEARGRLSTSMHRLLDRDRTTVARVAAALRQHSPKLRVTAARGRVAMAQGMLATAMRRALDRSSRRIALAGGKLDAVSPLATLERGYSIAMDARGAVVTTIAALKPGDTVRTRVADGIIDARVEGTRPLDQDRTK